MIRLRRKQKPEERILENTSPEPKSKELTLEPATSPSPTLNMLAWVRQRDVESITTEFQMTIQTKVSNLTTKEASILLMVCNVLGLRDGLDISLYLSMEFLYSFLTKSGSISPEEIEEERVRQTCLLTYLILSTFRGNWTDMGERIQILDQQVYEAVRDSNWLPDKRTFNSWIQHWEPERWLSVRIVPLDTLLNRSTISEPYSAYCKGYGEGTSRGPESTPYDYELDGEVYSEPLPPRFNLLEVEAYQRIHSAIEANRAKRIQTK
jgi:hypothetical protein